MLAFEAEQDASRLVVMLNSSFPDGERIGAGIVFGHDSNNYYIATANHNVRQGEITAGKIRVWFNRDANKAFDAQLQPHFDTTLDIAVLKVAGSGLDPEMVPYDRLADPKSIQRGDFVFPMGTPNGRPWAISLTPDRFAERREDWLYFESGFIAPGHSGGALWDEHLNIVGMIRTDQPPHGEALSIAKILALVKAWGYPVRLGVAQEDLFFDRVAVGDEHACAITRLGTAYCFGPQSFLLGAGTSASSERFRRVIGRHRFQSIELSRDFVCGLDRESSAWCWGSNSSGQLGNDSTGYRLHNSSVPVRVAGDHHFRMLSAGKFGICGLTAKGEAWCWGGIASRQRSAPERFAEGMQFISLHVTEGGACGRSGDRKLFCWSLDNLDRVSPIEASADTAALVDISLGGDYQITGCGLERNGSTQCWGSNVHGQLGDGLGGESSLKNDRDNPQLIAGGHRFVAVDVGEYHACAVTSKGAAWCWGDNTFGQLGDGSYVTRNAPVAVKSDVTFVQVKAGWGLTCGVSTSGFVYCWGKVMERYVKEPMKIPL